MTVLALQSEGLEYLHQGLYTEAIQFYEQCIEADPVCRSNYWHLGLALLLEEEQLMAESVWCSVLFQSEEEVTEIWTTELIQILDNTIAYHFQSNNLSIVKLLCSQIIGLRPSYFKPYFILGTVAFQQGQNEEAISYLKQAISLNPSQFELYSTLGGVLVAESALDEAIYYLNKAIAINPDDADAYTQLGLCYFHQKKTELAIQSFKQFLERNPSCGEIYIHLGGYLLLENHWSEALKYLNQAAKLDVHSNVLDLYLARAHRGIGNLDRAIEYAKKAIIISPENPKTYFILGSYLRDKGDIEGALINLSKASELDKKDLLAQQEIQKIKQADQAGYADRLRQGYGYWDAILFKDNDLYRLFYLTGSREIMPFYSVGSMGGAVSQDLRQWKSLGLIIQPSPAHSWKSGRILSGSVYKEEGTYYFFYAASPSEPHILHERIGLSKSTDATRWEHQPDVFLEMDKRYYGSQNSQYKDTIVKNISWRDPFIFKDQELQKYYMFITANDNNRVGQYTACLGLAVADKIDGPYQTLPPVLRPTFDEINQEGIFNEMERSQIIFRNNKFYVFFSASVSHVNPEWINRVGEEQITDSSLYCYVAERLTGPYRPLSEKPIVKGSDKTGLYATNFIEGPDGKLMAYGTYPSSFTLEVSPRFSVIWESDAIEIIVS